MFAWSTFLTYAFITAITPGPNNIMSWGNGMKQGFVRALPFNFGVLFGFLIVMFGCYFAWLADERRIVIGHCGEHLPVSGRRE